MNHLRRLLKWDLLLLHRNNLFLVAALIAVIYIGIFFLLKDLGNLSNLLVVLVFNDPVVTCFLFAAVIWMFDLNQRTLQAFMVLPVSINVYYWSKAIILTSLAVLVALIMSLAGVGLTFNLLHLLAGVAGSSLIFINLGFILGVKAGNFNRFLAYTVPTMILMALPFLSIFELVPWYFMLPVPTSGSMFILKAAYQDSSFIYLIINYLHTVTWSVITYRLAISSLKNISL